MAKVADMLGDYTDPIPDSAYQVPWEIANRIAAQRRLILNRDLDESDIALEIKLYSRSLTNDEYMASDLYLNAGERRSWRDFLNYDEFLQREIERANHRRQT